MPDSQERILLVDDERAIVDAATTGLTRAGYQVKGTQSPHEAIDLAPVLWAAVKSVRLGKSVVLIATAISILLRSDARPIPRHLVSRP